MPSNVLTKEDKGLVLADIDRLLGRGVGFLPCPLVDHQDHMKVLASRVRLEDWTAAKHAAEGGYPLRLTSEYKMPYYSYDGRPMIFAVKTPEQVLWHPRWESQRHRAKWEKDSPFTDSEMQFILGPGLGSKFASWVVDVKQFHREAVSTYQTCEQIVKMASTPGQLKRMMPDLVSRLGRSAQRILRDQKRASSMPFEWAEFPREPVYAAEALLAKCYLLPDSHVVWSSRNINHTWLA